MELSHINEKGEALMVNIGDKSQTSRYAKAKAEVKMQAETLSLIKENNLKKGDALSVARIAGIMAAKKTYELIPLCHNIPIDSVEIEFEIINPDLLVIYVYAYCQYKTGIEMEVLTAASVAALTIYDMCKAVDKTMTIGEIKLLQKTGGKSGDYTIS